MSRFAERRNKLRRSFKAAGVDDFIHLNANCQALLTTLQKKMGVAQ